jgi:hypothetical protein
MRDSVRRLRERKIKGKRKELEENLDRGGARFYYINWSYLLASLRSPSLENGVMLGVVPSSDNDT